MGRTARAGSTGNALLILRPEELGFLRYLKQSKVNLNEFEFSWSKIADISSQVGYKSTINITFFENSNYFLSFSARETNREELFLAYECQRGIQGLYPGVCESQYEERL